MISTKYNALIVSILFLLTSCSMGDDYTRPNIEMPDHWLHKLDKHSYHNNLYGHFSYDQWWHLFKDDTLNQIVEEGLQANQDLQIAFHRIEAAQASAQAAGLAFFPTINAQETSQRNQISANTKPPLPAGAPRLSTSHSGVLNLSYEIDFWGRVRRLHESSQANFISTIYGREQIKITLISQIVSAYFDLRSLQEQLKVAKSTVHSRNEALQIRTLRYDAGTISLLELMQMKAEAAGVAARVPAIELSIAKAESALSILLGRNPSIFPDSVALSKVSTETELPERLPSELLVNRPDIISAEQKLIAANADLGAAKAAFFPKISLTGFAGALSAEFTDLTKSRSSIFNGTITGLLPIFDANALQSQEELARTNREIALLTYQKTIQTALKETEDSMVSLQKSKEVLHHNQVQVAALQSATTLAEQRYYNGVSSYIEVLDAQRNLFQSELNLIDGQRQTIGSIISFVKAIGGGFKPSMVYQEYFGAPLETVEPVSEERAQSDTESE